MKAMVCKAFGPVDSLSFEEVPAPTCGPGQVRVAVKVAGCNFPDILQVEGKYQFKPALPFSPGSELSGVVKAVGPEVTGLLPGDRVMAFTLHGAFAEEVVADAACVVPMPTGMDFGPAAALLLTYGTADHALRDRAAVTGADTVLVLGAAGGIGRAIAQTVVDHGACVVVTDLNRRDVEQLAERLNQRAGRRLLSGALLPHIKGIRPQDALQRATHHHRDRTFFDKPFEHVTEHRGLPSGLS